MSMTRILLDDGKGLLELIAEELLALLFPPRLPGVVRDWNERAEYNLDFQGSVSPARPKRYRDGIERFFAENPDIRYTEAQARMVLNRFQESYPDVALQPFGNSYEVWNSLKLGS